MPNKDKNIPKRRFKAFENADAWELRKVGEICSISTGKSNTQDRDEQGKFPFYVRSPIIEKSTKYLFDEEAVLTVGDGVGTGKVFHYVNGKYDLHQRVYRMFSFTHVNAKYFYYYFSKKFFDRVMAMTAKNSVDSVRLEMISDMEITFPQLEEQEKIVKVLSTLDQQITLHQRKLDKLKNVKQAYLSEMFPAEGERVPKRRFPGFTDAWELRRFSELAEIRRGLTYSPTSIRKEGIRVLRSSNIDEDTFTFGEDDVFVDKGVVKIPLVKEGDILITAANGSSRLVGKHTIIKGLPANSTVHGGFMLLASCRNPEFVNSLMSSEWYNKFISLYVAGGNGAIGNLNKNDLDNQLVVVPSTSEQSAIGTFFSTLDQQITLHQRKLEKLKNLKKALLNELFV
ncbi:restriction endonuclease subunit S [Streptococcus suis]